MNPAKILIVDDEASIRFYLEETLSRDGYQISSVDSGEAAIELIKTEEFDLALIDLKMKAVDGMQVLTTLRQSAPDTAVIVLTAYASLDTAVEALRMGAHDYLFKPCKTVELRSSVATGLQKRQRELRQRAVLTQLERDLRSSLDDIHSASADHPLSRPPAVAEEDEDQSQTRFLRRQGLVVDLIRHVSSYNNQIIELSPTEFNLLAFLISESPRVVSPQEMVRAVLGYESNPWEARDTARYHICRLRQKLGKVDKERQFIKTVRGVGYSVGD